MRKYALTALCLLACASIITASTITQQVDATSRNIAPIDRIKVMTDSLYDLTNTDVPALISNLNAAGDGTAGLLQSVTPSTGTFSVATNANIGNDLVVTNDVTIGGAVGITGETTIDGKYAVVGPDITTGLMIQTTNVTMHSGTVWTQTWAVAFGATPIMTATYTEDPGITNNIYITAGSSTTCLVTVASDKNFGLIGVGARP